MTVPIYVCACIITLATAIISDRKKQRSPAIIIGFTIAACGFLALLAIPHPKLPGLTYGFLFMAATGLYMPLVCIVSWIGSSPPHSLVSYRPPHGHPSHHLSILPTNTPHSQRTT